MPMIMTEKKLANSLVDDLIELAVFAIGHSPQEEEKRLIEEYARKTFLSLCAEWSDLTREDWQVLINK